MKKTRIWNKYRLFNKYTTEHLTEKQIKKLRKTLNLN